ncbi:sec-independent protein translocase protein TatA [Singulisphaera sp. GP187]|uniref:twin-arginine translocase TatA/TatE family subunit n=1 Tax=Singulisphaera sp. GP187 TaxID=1882752 RepID=UPI000928BD81|nr:twin-arginine translocase TatA/TatE family subunit [Singulisphaera sp. GP187]SIO44914.1 sec-independent protein translocase protein TatA [Singulisphaera sp. GP187]
MLPNLGPLEMIIVMAVAVLLFGKRLPEVGRSLGKGIVEFKKGLRGLEDELDFSSTMSSHTPSRRAEERARPVDSIETSVPKFEPPTVPPIPQMEMNYEPQPAQD